ncbi:PE-PGRS family protein [Streptomyces venezuelae]|uniref:PE-PGRS family protein n=1 Tax=Streptomyces venezuelae TaxID=54571 RepID=UPI00123E2EC4|nr:PE-PGRS family protein [Streptomyces venezuelae]QES12636.1 PE-PGRS family protein [Streptomyces venezuelae]
MADTDATAGAAPAPEDSTTVIGLGVTGVAGYARPAPRDPAREQSARAGVLGVGDQSAHSPGVAGFGEIGVIGSGSLCGVHGRGETGVRGETLFSEGVYGVARATGAGVVGESKDGPGVLASSRTDAGLRAQSVTDVGGVFSSGNGAQIELTPLLADDPDVTVRLPAAGRLGQLAALSDDGSTCRLYLCVQAPENAPAHWAEIQLGPPVEGGPQ